MAQMAHASEADDRARLADLKAKAYRDMQHGKQFKNLDHLYPSEQQAILDVNARGAKLMAQVERAERALRRSRGFMRADLAASLAVVGVIGVTAIGAMRAEDLSTSVGLTANTVPPGSSSSGTPMDPRGTAK